MNPLETVRAAIMALRDHKLRSGLTALGIIIGTSATIAMLAIGAGARAQVAAQVQSLGSNLLVVVSGNVSQSGVRLGAGGTPTLTDEDAAAISQEIPSVQVTSSLISGFRSLRKPLIGRQICIPWTSVILKHGTGE